MLIHVILTTTLRGQYYHHLHFTNKKAKHREMTWDTQGCTEAVALITEFFELSLKALFIPLILEKAGLVREIKGCIQVKCSRRGDDCIEILGEHDRVNGCSVISLQKNEQSPLGCFGYLHRKNRFTLI